MTSTSNGPPLQITFKGIGPTPAIERTLHRKLAWLRRCHPHIMSCRVTVEAPHQRQRKGRLYSVRVDVTVPGGDLAVTRSPALDHAHEDLRVAIRDAFDSARRELMDDARRQRHQVKTPVGSQRGRVTRLEIDHGFLEAEDGRERYFHRNSVLGGFERLVVGTTVRFADEVGDKGPQASTVAVVHPRSRPALGSGGDHRRRRA